MMKLNNEQYRASRADVGITIVLAGAGTGKTATIMAKTFSLVNEGAFSPSSILILTFSRKAAEELSERLRRSAAWGERVPVETFHSYALDFIRREIAAFYSVSGYSGNITILDDNEKEKFLSGIITSMKDEFLGIPFVTIRYLIEYPEKIAEFRRKGPDGMLIAGAIETVNKKFASFKREKHALDFNDLISFAILMLKSDRSLCLRERSRYSYLMVDEFQDSSEDNIELLRLLLSEENPNLFVVGDDWQSIYGFRRARPEYLISSAIHKAPVCRYVLRENYRSHSEIVELSAQFISRNKTRSSKTIVPVRGSGGAVLFVPYESAEEELMVLCRILSGERCGDTAILYRNNWQGEIIRKSFELSGLEELLCGVSLMTMHASKGLEFRRVIIVGVDDAIVPSADSPLEEERRLFYVALSRAKDSLCVLYRIRNGIAAQFARECGVKKR